MSQLNKSANKAINKVICNKAINQVANQAISDSKATYNWSELNPFTSSKAMAQGVKYVDAKPNVYKATEFNSQSVEQIKNVGQEALPVPILIILFMFIIFIFIMSIVYIYHWVNFSLGDKFIKNATSIYFLGLIVLSLPLIFFLI